jgi:hypothetical protein
MEINVRIPAFEEVNKGARHHQSEGKYGWRSDSMAY